MKRLLAICILSSPAVLAQSTVTGSRTVLGSWDASGASATKPARAGASLPGTCSQGEFFFNTAAGSGQNIYLCNPSNSWSQVSGGGTVSNLLSAAHGDTTPASVVRGATITGQGSSPTWSLLALGATSRYLRSNGTDLLYSSVAAAGAGACSTGQVMTAGNDNAAPTCAAPAYSWLTGVPTAYYQTVQSNTVGQNQRTNLNFSAQFSLTDSSGNNSTTVGLAATIGANTTGNAATATALAAAPSQCGSNTVATGVAASGNANCSQPGFASLSGTATASQIPTNVRARAVGATFSGGGTAITVGSVSYFTVPFACTISAWNITVDTGTAAFDVWKIATGTAVPTVANTITASAQPAISSGTALHGTTLTGWTTAVTANDIFAFKITAVSNTTLASLILECDQ